MKQQQALTVPLVIGLVVLVGWLLVLDRPSGERASAPAPTTSPTASGGLPAPAPPPPSPTTSPTTSPTPGNRTPTGSPSAQPSDQACATGAPAAAQRITALTFNIHGGLGGGGLRLGTIADEIAASGADLVFLQEVDRGRRRSNGTDQPSFLARRLGMEVAFGSNVRHRPAGPGRPPGQYGTAILSRWPITAQRNVALPNRAGLEQRGLLVAEVDVDGTRIHVYGTHLQHTRGSIRLQQMRAVTRVVAADPVPHLVAGDFNAEPDSRVLATIGRHLSDPWPEVGDGPGLTVPPREPRRRIDFVLHDHWFTPVAATTLRSAVSDHRAVRVVLDLQTLPTCLPG